MGHTLELVSYLFQQRQSSTCLRTKGTNEAPGLTPSATVRTANWLRHLPAPHHHVDDKCSDSGEPLERRRQLTIPHHSQPELPFRRLRRPFINNTRIDTPIASRPRTVISLARPPKCGSGLDWPTSEVGFRIGRQPPPCMTATNPKKSCARLEAQKFLLMSTTETECVDEDMRPPAQTPSCDCNHV